LSNPNILDEAVRKKIIDEIGGSENLSRKRYEQRKFDIYRNRQAAYVLERLSDEFSSDTVQRMRKVLSINPCKRIIDQLGSIYAQEPERHFSGTDDGPETQADESMEKKLEDFYHCNGVDPQMRLANRYYKLCDQAALYIVPKLGKIQPRALTPKDYDVIPDFNDPEQAFCYILNVFDVNLYGVRNIPVKENTNRYNQNSRVPQDVSNDSDRAKLLQRFVWWTDEVHFTTNGYGTLTEAEGIVPNPIKRLPFIDIANEKDFQFFVRRGNNIAEFTIDLLVQLCDLAEISRLQGYSQAIIYSIDEPKSLTVGPNRCMWIKQPADAQASQPKFAFESPSPDLANALEIINVQLKMFLSSNGLDSSVVSGDTPKRAFTSGIDHLLANIDKFQASQEDVDLFRRVETDLFDIMRLWSNEYQTVTGDDALNEDLQIGIIPDTVELEVCYPEPSVVETKKDKEDSTIKRWDNDLLTTKDALKELYEFDDIKADEYLLELAADKVANPRPATPGLGQPGAETPMQANQPPPVNGADNNPMPPKKQAPKVKPAQGVQ
jgi:hypothetical protein